MKDFDKALRHVLLFFGFSLIFIGLYSMISGTNVMLIHSKTIIFIIDSCLLLLGIRVLILIFKLK